MEFNSWKIHGFEGLKTGPNLGYIKCFSILYQNSDSSKYGTIPEILDILTNSRFSYTTKVIF